ncbi:MAG: dihydrofolate reductase family protein [Acidimicrobiales bacterium]
MTLPPLRMPMASASRKGVSAVAAQAEERRVILTSHGRPVAVVDAASRLDEDVRLLREASRTVVECAAEAVAERRPAKLDLASVCDRLGIDVDSVQSRAAARLRR